MKLVAPRQKPSVSVPAAAASTSKKGGSNWSASASGKATKAHNKRSKKTLTPIKFGPPRAGQKQDNLHGPSDRDVALAAGRNNTVAADNHLAGSISAGGDSGGGIVADECLSGAAVADRSRDGGFAVDEGVRRGDIIDGGRSASFTLPNGRVPSRGPTPPTSRPASPVFISTPFTPRVAEVPSGTFGTTFISAPQNPVATSARAISLPPAISAHQGAPPRASSATPVARRVTSFPGASPAHQGTPLRTLSAAPDATSSVPTALAPTPPHVEPFRITDHAQANVSPTALGHLATAEAPSAAVQFPTHSGSIAVPNVQESRRAEDGKMQRKRSGTTTNTGSHAKKRKTDQTPASSSSSSSTAAPIDASDDGNPLWVTNALTLFNSADLGAEWQALISTWLEFEKVSDYEEIQRLGCRRRPHAVGEWIQHARSVTYSPKIKNISKFGTEFAAWWKNIQPTWRMENANGQTPLEEGNWEEIRRPGLNGLLSVIAGLFFWGNAIRTTPQAAAARATWLKVLNDVAYVVERLSATAA